MTTEDLLWNYYFETEEEDYMDGYDYEEELEMGKYYYSKYE